MSFFLEPGFCKNYNNAFLYVDAAVRRIINRKGNVKIKTLQEHLNLITGKSPKAYFNN